MNEATQAEKDRRHDRIDALTDGQRRTLLAYLCGYAPEAVDRVLDELEGGWRPLQHGESDDQPPR